MLPYAISKLQGAGYRLVTIAECLGLPAYQSVGSPQTPDVSIFYVNEPSQSYKRLWLLAELDVSMNVKSSWALTVITFDRYRTTLFLPHTP